MSCGSTHKLAGAVAGVSVSALDKEDTPWCINNPAIASIAGAAGGKLPDILEPAVHPNHRQFFHSIVFFVLAAKGMHQLYKWQPDEEWQKVLRHLGLVIGAGYISHLVFDAVTPKSLPLI